MADNPADYSRNTGKIDLLRAPENSFSKTPILLQDTLVARIGSELECAGTRDSTSAGEDFSKIRF